MSIWIQTYTGKAFDPFDPKLESIDIVDIAHSLSLICRFNGHCKEFYSVASHSLNCLHVLKYQVNNPKILMTMLLHDAAEAYICDIPRPIKNSCMINDWYHKVEKMILFNIMHKFGGIFPFPEIIKKIDNQMLATEARDIMVDPPRNWELIEYPLHDFHIMSPVARMDYIESEFYKTFNELTEKLSNETKGTK